MDDFYNLSWYELHLLVERRNHIEEEKKLIQKLEYIRHAELLTKIDRIAGGKANVQDYLPDWIKSEFKQGETEKDTRTPDEILEKFRKIKIDGK